MKLENVAMLLPNRTVGYGTLETEGHRISKIEIRSQGVRPPDGVSRLVLPGLVNCHGHTAMTLVRGVGGGLPLQRWLEEAIFPIEAKMTPEDIEAGAAWGALEMLAGGTTCVADMYDFPANGGAAFDRLGIRSNVCRVGLNFVPGRLQDCIDFTRAYNAGAVDSGEMPAHISRNVSRLSVADICIHSEYLTDEKFCRELAAANRDLRRPVHLHVSETKREHDECLRRHGKTPIAYLAKTGLLDYGGYAAHGVWCTDDDFLRMAEKNVTLVHNPSSNLKLGSGFARIPRALSLGVNVALGTDGCASNDNLDLFEEMHLASLIHKGVACDPTVLSAWDVIEMATKNGAKALGRTDCGELAEGKCADFCVVDLERPHLTPALDLPNLVVHSMHASDVVTTVVDGKVVYDRGTWPGADVDALRGKFLAAIRRLFDA